MPPRPDSPSRAFTLLETLIVIVIIVIMSAITVPRLAATDNRSFELGVDQVADLLTMYAQREALGQKAIGLEHDPQENALRLLVVDRDPFRPDDPPDWVLDRMVKPVRLPSVIPAENVSIRADGDLVDTASWPLTHDLGEERPTIEISLATSQRSTTLVLAPHALSPVRRENDPGVLAIRTRIDLDAAGRDREDW
ncbi:MAG: prepilin-type N-terminal cleavage/methylation domain-containing protein [Planctomycetota bacterium]|jgi:prepilin-type N-terminal cleavage/methylation domain-containing protein